MNNVIAASDGDKLACYVCLGSDMDDCIGEKVCCAGACFKMVDTKHQMIAKVDTDTNDHIYLLRDAQSSMRKTAVRNDAIYPIFVCLTTTMRYLSDKFTSAIRKIYAIPLITSAPLNHHSLQLF